MENWWEMGKQFLQALRTPLGIMASGAGEHFHALFGRDSLWTIMLALETAQLRPEDQGYWLWVYDLSATVLRGLAQLQGRVENDYNEEQPGKIVHEYWNPVPAGHQQAGWPMVEGRYYGTFDATFLYIIAAHNFYQLFQDEQLLDELWPNIEAALHWALHYSDTDNDGLVEYSRRNSEGRGLLHHVWKDSSDAILPSSGLPLEHPIAWIEVQGYALNAYACMRTLYKKRGELTPELDAELMMRIETTSVALQRFWLDNEGCPAIALDGNKNPVTAVSSNAGHLLWSKAIEPDLAAQIAGRLMQPDMLTDWGLRTLSQHVHYYSPLAYHRGTVWPFDNAVIAIGLHHYGFEAEARRIASSVMRAIEAFSLPVELYCVIPSRWIREPRIKQDWLLVDYPQSCIVQAWTAGAILYFMALLEQS
jgi:glycogen debranching enzyme